MESYEINIDEIDRPYNSAPNNWQTDLIRHVIFPLISMDTDEAALIHS